MNIRLIYTTYANRLDTNRLVSHFFILRVSITQKKYLNLNSKECDLTF